jgi:hypothetical protein
MDSQCSARVSVAARKGSDSIVRRRHFLLGGTKSMASSLLQLMDELLQSIEQRDAGDPDAPAWEASARIQRIEEELARRMSDAGVERGAVGVATAETRQPDKVFAAIA